VLKADGAQMVSIPFAAGEALSAEIAGGLWVPELRIGVIDHAGRSNGVPLSATTTAGGSVVYTVAVGAQNGFAGTVNLLLTGLSASQPLTAAARSPGQPFRVWGA
jgi:hypothetical protein